MSHPNRVKILVIFTILLLVVGFLVIRGQRTGPRPMGTPLSLPLGAGGRHPKWTREQNLFKPLPETSGNQNDYTWVYETIGGEKLALDGIWRAMPVLLVFFDYDAPASHDSFREAFRLDTEFGTVLKVVGLNLYDEGRKRDPNELGGLLGELVSTLRYQEELKDVYDYSEMLGMAVVQLPRNDRLRQKFGQAGIGTATLVGVGGEVIYAGMKGSEIYDKSTSYILSAFERQKYYVADFGKAPHLANASTKSALWIFWTPDSLPSLEALQVINEMKDSLKEWTVTLFTLAPERQATDTLKKMGGFVGKTRTASISWQDLERVFGSQDLFLPALAVVGSDGHLWYLGSGGWTAEDLERILTEVIQKTGGQA
ncbi:MAG: hypothetical protein V2G42_04810 [bacterium JZ-2024 1]